MPSYNVSVTWKNVESHRSYFQKKYSRGPNVRINHTDTPDQVTEAIKDYGIMYGDVLYFYNREKKKFSHAGIISEIRTTLSKGVYTSEIRYCGHSIDRKDHSLMKGIARKGISDFDHVLVLRMKK